MKIIFFSDTHLFRESVDRTNIVETFLRDECAKADMVFLLGDLFEFYHGYRRYIFPWYQSIAEAIKAITKKGKTVYFVEGNHEFGMGRYFQSYTGAVCVNEVAIDIDGKRTFVAHGDKFVGGPVRMALKSRFASGLMDFFGPRLTWAIAMGARIVLSKREKPYKPSVIERFRGYARRKFAEGYDAVVLAHSHMPDKMEVDAEGKGKVYLNTGDFFANATYVIYESGKGFEVKKHRFTDATISSSDP
jgi:UDP-2,3-diacylglucosamine hydrolase